FLVRLPDRRRPAGVVSLNALARLIDRLFGYRISQYGWGFVFAAESASLPPLRRPYCNVCSKCGSGVSAKELRDKGLSRQCFGVGFYYCPICQQLNAFVLSPIGCE